MRISDWSSDVCSSDLAPAALQRLAVALGEQRVGESDERLGERHLPCRLPCRFWAPAAILQPTPEAQQDARVARRGQRLAEHPAKPRLAISTGPAHGGESSTARYTQNTHG